ncbi:hypothetical protein HMPREF1982_01565 [Clostridiales bacterium oral taxon 876 str. F0540]|nr:hypothetical protein HMPREF1982_01565 [Clostridiales bacterium oral taxon 876 str. F0540]
MFEVDLTRTRDEEILNKLDIVYDVGGGELDHHGNNKVYREDGTPYAACGLIWNKFGKEVVKFKAPKLDEDEVEDIFNYIDRNFIEGVDALDNGIWIDKTDIPLVHISSIISGFNPLWNSDQDENEAFNEAVEVSRAVLRNMMYQRLSVLESKERVIKAYNKRKNPQLLVLDRYCPYSEALKDADEKKEVLFVIYPRKDSYAMQSVRGENSEDKKKLPKEWAGLRDEELALVTGVPDAVFCHTGRFIAVAKSLGGIMKLAELAVQYKEENEIKESKGFLEFLRNILKKAK